MGNFTDTYIKSLKPRAKRYETYEGGGFGIRVTPHGVKTWIYRYKITDKTDRITLGHYPSMSLANAKKRFIELSELRRDGQIPKAIIQQQQDNQRHTVQKLMEAWYTGYIEKNRKQPLQIKQQMDADIIPLLGHHPLDTLQARNITRALDTIVKRGAPVHANKVLSTLKQALNYGVSRGDLPSNPAASIRTRDIGGLEKPRERHLTLDEIKTLWLFLDDEGHRLSLPIKNGIKILILTGVRSSELRLATFAEFHWENALWSIPDAHTKSGKVMKVHLTPLVQTLLQELQASTGSPYVMAGKSGPLTDKALSRAIHRIQERVGIPHWTAHDLRRTFATQLGEALHVDPVVIEKCLGHSMPKIMATYNKNEMLPQRREALEKWAQHIEALLTDNVIPFTTKKVS